jgi:NAD(P)-dependent dehydrogenase (short-subunit alcohol dehydrogenase family)
MSESTPKANEHPCSSEDPEILEEELKESFNTNVIGLINTINAFIPLVRKGSAKKVIAISSAMGDTGFVNELHIDVGAPYSISKAGVGMVIAKYNATFEKEGILFMAICPGSVDTRSGRPEEGKSKTCYVHGNEH